MIMPQDLHDRSHELRQDWFCGNEEAIAFIAMFFDAVELWDDLIDKDVPISDDHINRAFTALMFGLPANDWFVFNRKYYLPLIMMAINAFHDANLLADSTDKRLRLLAFHIRNIGLEIHIATAFLLGGYDHMRIVSPEIRKFFALEDCADG